VLIRSHPPKENWVRLNNDGSSKDSVKAGCGGLIRGSDSEWLYGFSKFISNCSAYVVELWVYWKSLVCFFFAANLASASLLVVRG
jgi:hypothetical protein